MNISHHPQSRLLSPSDPFPVEIVNPAGGGDVLLICEHAGREIPSSLGDLGIAAAEMDRHIAYDIGARDLACMLAQRLDARLVAQRYSRLVIDCNRPTEADDSIPSVSDGTEIPANSNLDEQERTQRVTEIFEPFDRTLTEAIRACRPKAIFAIHSFNPVLRGVRRPWDIGFLYRKDERTSRALEHYLLAAAPDLSIGMQQPYTISDQSDWFVPVHGERNGIAHSLIEVRNDHISHPGGVARFADLLAGAIDSFTKGSEKEWN